MTSLAGVPLDVLRELRRSLAPEFAGDAQERFFDSHAPELLYSGAMGAGKSRILCEKAWRLALTYPGATFGIFRKVARSLSATTMRTFQRDVLQPSLIARGNRTESWYELSNGSRIYFLGLDPDPITGVPSKVGSLDLAWAGVDEAVECTEGDWILLQGRLRDPRMPWHQLCAATNPADPRHWLKLRFTPSTPEREYLHATAQDNRFLPDDYRARIADLPDNTIGRRLGRGEWAAVEGAIWHVEDWQVRADGSPPKRVVAGLDWGFVHAFAMEVVAQSGSGRLSVRDEIHVKGAGLDQVIPHVADALERHAVSLVVCDPSEPGLMATLRRGLAAHREGHAACTLHARVEGARNDMAPGLQAVDKHLRAGMTIDPRCAGLLGEIPGYTWAPDRLGGFHERPVDVNDDACDALRYAVMAFEQDPDNPWASLSSVGGVA